MAHMATLRATTEYGAGVFGDALDGFDERLQKKLDALDEIKLSRAIASNSSRYLPEALRHVDAEDAAAGARIRAKAVDVMSGSGRKASELITRVARPRHRGGPALHRRQPDRRRPPGKFPTG
jgi:hypothetical protein